MTDSPFQEWVGLPAVQAALHVAGVYPAGVAWGESEPRASLPPADSFSYIHQRSSRSVMRGGYNRGGLAHGLGLHPIVTSQHRSTALYHISYHIQ
jgi:hypothetical protein